MNTQQVLGNLSQSDRVKLIDYETGDEIFSGSVRGAVNILNGHSFMVNKFYKVSDKVLIELVLE